jgi:hypothetical protein
MRVEDCVDSDRNGKEKVKFYDWRKIKNIRTFSVVIKRISLARISIRFRKVFNSCLLK